MPRRKKGLEPSEKLFVDTLMQFEPDLVTEAIEKQVDIAERFRAKIPETDLILYRQLARAYANLHPEYKSVLRKNLREAAMNVINGLKEYAPEHARRILEGPMVDFRSLGLAVSCGGSSPAFGIPLNNPEVKYPEAGIEFVERTLMGFRRLLGV